MKNTFIIIFLSVSSFVFAQKLEHNPNRDPSQNIEKVPGLKIVPPTGTTNQFCLCCSSDSKIKPLIVINGEIIPYDDFKNIDTEKIESVDVLKGDKAVSEFGEAGKNGVILVKAKNNWKLKKKKDTEPPLIAS